MKIKWLGHACFMLEGSKKILIDPFMPFGNFGCADKADIVAVTHAHADHLGETIKLGKTTVCHNELSHYLRMKGVDTIPMNIGGSVETEGVRFTMVPALHSSSIEDDEAIELEMPLIYAGTAAGFVIRMDGVSVYHAGDTGIFSDMKLIHDLYHPDVAILPIGDKYTMGPTEAMMAAEFVGAPLVIPMHYNTFPVLNQDVGAFKAAIERVTDMKVAVLNPGEEITVGN